MSVVKPRAWFENWRDPREFHRTAHRSIIAHALKTEATGAQTPQYLSEAFPVGALGVAWGDTLSPCKVRLELESAEFPDAHLSAKDESLLIEVTMALTEGRPLFKELREWEAKFKHGEIVTSLGSQERRANARKAIPMACMKKVHKDYAVPPDLLVYLVQGADLSIEEQVELTRENHAKFKSVWLLNGLEVVRTWPSVRMLKMKPPIHLDQPA